MSSKSPSTKKKSARPKVARAKAVRPASPAPFTTDDPRAANLHNEIVAALGADHARMGDDVELYGAAYRPVVRDGETEVDVWCVRCEVGAALPVLPLRLRGDLFVPVDFESTYQEACRRRRIEG